MHIEWNNGRQEYENAMKAMMHVPGQKNGLCT